MHIHQEFFTDDVALRLRRAWEDVVLGRDKASSGCSCAACLQQQQPPLLLFVSDVRTADWRVMTDGACVRARSRYRACERPAVPPSPDSSRDCSAS